jgi:hypothetical protein
MRMTGRNGAAGTGSQFDLPVSPDLQEVARFSVGSLETPTHIQPTVRWVMSRRALVGDLAVSTATQSVAIEAAPARGEPGGGGVPLYVVRIPGTLPRTVVPSRGRLCTSSDPPNASSRSAIPSRPVP